MSRPIVIVLAFLSVAAALRLPSARPSQPRARAAQMGLFSGFEAGLAKLMAGEYDAEEIQGRLNRQIRTKPCLVYSMQNCEKCKKTKQVLSRLGAVHTYIDLDDPEDEDGMAMKAELIGMGHDEFPVVFALGEKLGDVVKMHEQGKLAEVLMKTGSLTATQRV